VNYVDFGSGFKVAYRRSEFSKMFNDYCKQKAKNYELKFEPGKFMVSNAGYFLSKVNIIKQTPATSFVGEDTGMNHLIRPMFYDAYHEIENISNPDTKKKIYSVVGYICETDTFAVDRRIAQVRKDDILMFRNAGAYCFSMASNYNSRYRPAEVLILDGKDHLIRERENFEDLLRGQIPLEHI
jgi:diaminopimelate decarboxylase